MCVRVFLLCSALEYDDDISITTTAIIYYYYYHTSSIKKVCVV